MNTSSTARQETNVWSIEGKGHFFWKPAIQRLWKALEQELNPEFFELLDSKTLVYRLAFWRDMSSWVLDRIFTLLKKDGYSYTLRFRGVHVSATAIHLHGYFEVANEATRFNQLRAHVDRVFRDYGCPVTLGQISIPIVRFKNIYSHKHLPNLDRWEECEFGEVRMASWWIAQDNRSYASVPLQKFIAHRGNVSGRFVPDENKPERIDELNAKGVGCEIDVWYTQGSWFLGHDEPQHNVSFEWLMKSLPLRLYHCKNAAALDKLHLECGRLGYEVNLFYHTVEDYAITSRGHIVVHPDQMCLPDSIEMMPELSKDRFDRLCPTVVCSDSETYLRKRALSFGGSAGESDSE